MQVQFWRLDVWSTCQKAGIGTHKKKKASCAKGDVNGELIR